MWPAFPGSISSRSQALISRTLAPRFGFVSDFQLTSAPKIDSAAEHRPRRYGGRFDFLAGVTGLSIEAHRERVADPSIKYPEADANSTNASADARGRLRGTLALLRIRHAFDAISPCFRQLVGFRDRLFNLLN